MLPAPWSPSALEGFKNCPKSFYEQRVNKSVRGSRTEHNEWGDRVHKAFEDFLLGKSYLPPDLKIHEEYLMKVRSKPGVDSVELRAAFDKKAQPTNWEWREDEIWARFKIDYIKVDMSADKPIAWIRDWKTGKQKDDFRQLIIYSLYAFALHKVDLCDVRFYWTQTQTETRKVFERSEVKDLWAGLIPDLRLYAQAFKEEKFPPRQSGLCNGWCPVETCEFWKPKRTNR